MSTYYFLICDDHRERTDAASSAAGGCALADGPHTLIPFIIAHCGCNVRIVSEHDEEGCSDDYEDWTEENVKEQKNKDRSTPLPPLIKNREHPITELSRDYDRMMAVEVIDPDYKQVMALENR